ncbi:MAG: DNA internalization-related competence protein ComEC/Rec2 [Gammaproteobacteria bacterium]|nr:DNA internalization-related competence protein ComEC/Rec2 [Gammaproteobacteria bacterium]
MRLNATMFLLGILVFQQLASLPDIPLLALAPLVSAGLIMRRTRPIAMALAGFLWVGVVATHAVEHGLDPELEGRDIAIEGVVVSVPTPLDTAGLRFDFRIERWTAHARRCCHPDRIRLSWYGAIDQLRAGERWRFQVRLKRPHGLMNPGGFNYEDWLFSRGIGATGYVRVGDGNRRLGRSGYALDRLQDLRQYLFESLQRVMADERMKGIVTALAMGERQGIDFEQWRVLTGTGTSHLVAISGLHVGLAAGAAYWLVGFLWARLGRLPLWLPAQRAGAVAGFTGALVYAALAGFSLPTQRALVMVAIAMAGIFWGNRHGAGRTLAVALFAVLIYDPLSVMSSGFWLSFGAVLAILISVRHRTRHSGSWWRWGRIHVVLGVALSPVLIYFFQSVPVYAPLANLFAVPWVAFVVVPLTLLGTSALVLWPALGETMLHLAAGGMEALWIPLEGLASLPGGRWLFAASSPWTLIPAFFATVLMLLPRGTPGRAVTAFLVIPLVMGRSDRPEEGKFHLALLDVGQGLAAVISTRDHTLIYDTGPEFGPGFDAGQAVIVPYLLHEGIERIDTVVISHGDRDHRGGLASLADAIPITRIVTGVPGGLDGFETSPCETGKQWVWNGVAFAFLHPAPGYTGIGNDRSCVLKVGPPGHGLLLPGDIEASAESALLERDRAAVGASVLVAPHHGSKTSSTEPFLRAVAPDLTLFAVGYRNRFGFPRPEIIGRYRRQGSARRDTARDGAILVDFSGRGDIERIVSYRASARRYWRWQDYFYPDEDSMMGR